MNNITIFLIGFGAAAILVGLVVFALAKNASGSRGRQHFSSSDSGSGYYGGYDGGSYHRDHSDHGDSDPGGGWDSGGSDGGGGDGGGGGGGD